jgi:CRP-like cAMP-binding protein
MQREFWFFDDVNLFQIMCPHKLGEQIKEGHFRSYSKGEVIYFTEDPATTLYLIANGKVRLMRYTPKGDEVVLNILTRGELFGELAILGGGKREEVAEAMEEDTMICPVKVDEIAELMKDNRSFAFKIHKLIGIKLKRLERKVEALVFKDVRERLAEFLVDWAEEHEINDDGFYEYRLTHKDIASLIGTSRQTVTTLMNEWRDMGWIEFNRKSFRILNQNALSNVES